MRRSPTDFGGKSTIASEVWARLGCPDVYVEPFAGSAAMLLARPDSHAWWDRIETINDADGLISNVWRAIQCDPDAVAAAADHPVNECDLHARHIWLVNNRESLTERLCGDPDWCDPRAAGWWIWGACSWIAGGWCAGNGPWNTDGERIVNTGDGVKRQMPHLGTGRGVNRKMPHLGSAGRGVNRQIRSAAETHCEDWAAHIRQMMRRLSNRLRRVRVCSGDWLRVCGSDTTTTKRGTCGIFLDPPYSHEERHSGCYATEMACAAHVREWAIERGRDPEVRIALCGYNGEHEFPADWTCWRWKASGGYGSQGESRGRENAGRECVWFSPKCLTPQPSLMALMETD